MQTAKKTRMEKQTPGIGQQWQRKRRWKMVEVVEEFNSENEK